MGTDKAFIEIEGLPMVVRAAEALQAAGAAPTLVVGGDDARLNALGLDVVEDRYPGEGPLGGVITALGAIDSHGGGIDAVVTLPCDVISPDAAAVCRVLDGLGAAGGDVAVGSPAADAAVPIGAGVPQWAHAAWRRHCLRPLLEAFERGVRAPREAARQLHTVEVEVPGEGWYRDADRPEDLPATTIDGGHTTEAGMEVADIPEIDIDEFERRRAGGAAVFDVREPDEYIEVRIPGAVLVPLASVPEAVEDFRTAAAGQAVCVVCAVGGRSGQAVGFLRSLGVDAVNVAGGTNAWHKSGRPVETGPAST